MATKLQHSCGYFVNGCSKKYATVKNLEKHMLQCPSRIIGCPAQNCINMLTVEDLTKHFEKSHKNSFCTIDPKTNYKFSIAQKKSFTDASVIVTPSASFVIEKRNNADSKTFLLKLMYLQKNADINNSELVYFFKVIASDGDKGSCYTTPEKPIEPFKSNLSEDDMFKIDQDWLLMIMRGKNFQFELKIKGLVQVPSQKAASGLASGPFPKCGPSPEPSLIDLTNPELKNEKILSPAPTTLDKSNLLYQQLECPICNDLMLPPIFTCKIGHSICSICKERLTICPTCQATFEGTRNFALETLAEHVEFSCRNAPRGCTFKGVPNNIQNHGKFCRKQMMDCPVSCSWEGMLDDLSTHLKDIHCAGQTFNLNAKRYYDLDKNMADQFVIAHNERVFKIGVDRFPTRLDVRFIVQDVNLKESEKPLYHFVIQGVDQTNSKRVLVADELCYDQDNSDKKNDIRLPLDLWAPFIKDGKLWYRLDLQKLD